MPEYEFENKLDGKIQDFYFEFKDAPRVGDTVIIEGVEWIRIITKPPAAIVQNLSKIE